MHTRLGGLSYGVMAAQLVLVQLVEVRILVRQQNKLLMNYYQFVRSFFILPKLGKQFTCENEIVFDKAIGFMP